MKIKNNKMRHNSNSNSGKPKLLLRFLVLLLAFAAPTNATSDNCASSSTKQPVQIENLSVDDHARAKFIDALKTFGEENGFVVRIAQTTPDGKHFHIAMRRSDLSVRFLNSFDPQVFRIAFYITCEQIVSKETITLLIDDLKAKLSLISGIESRTN